MKISLIRQTYHIVYMDECRAKYLIMTTKQLGNIGEAKALSKFVEMNIPVYVAFGDNEKADLIAEFNGKLNKIQVKT